MCRCIFILTVLIAGSVFLGNSQADSREDGQVLCWNFDQGQADRVPDMSGNGNNGLVKGRMKWVEGISGQAVEIKGKDGSIFCDDNNSLNPEKLTVAFWLWPVLWNSSLDNSANTVLNKGWDKGWGIDPHYWGEKISLCANIGGGRRDASALVAVPENAWSYIVITFDGRQASFYLNGKLLQQSVLLDEEGVKTGRRLDSKNNALKLGGSSLVIARFDEVKIYSRALTAEEVAENYKGLSAKAASAGAAAGAGNSAKESVFFSDVKKQGISDTLIVNGITLIEKGEAKSVIGLASEHVAVATSAAAYEMRLYLHKIFGVTLPIERQGKDFVPDKKKNIILLGDSAASRSLGFPAGPLESDGYEIASRGNALVIAGRDGLYIAPDCGTAAGTLYGVYRFLEEMGVRWYFPGETGEVLPDKKVVRIDNLRVREKPYFVQRILRTPPGADENWVRRIGFGGSVYAASSCHSFQEWPDKYRKTHPEYLSLLPNGQRGSEVCWYGPGVREQMIKDAKAYFADHPDAAMYPDFTVMRNDGAIPCCMCAECQKRRTPEEGWYGELSDYAAEAAVEVAGAIKKDYPDRRVIIGAYEQLTRPPVKIKQLPDNVSVQIMKHRLLLKDEEVKGKLYDEVINGWLKLKPKTVSFWEYYCFDCWGEDRLGLPGLATKVIGEDIKRLKQLSEKSKIPFLGELIFPDGRAGEHGVDRLYWLAPDLYVTAKLLWNPDLSVEAMMQEFYVKYFGPAAGPMKKFYARLENVWMSEGWGKNNYAKKMSEAERAKKSPPRNYWKEVVTPEVLKELAGYLSEAKKLNKDNPYKERLEVVEKGFRFTVSQAEKYGGASIPMEGLEQTIIRY